MSYDASDLAKRIGLAEADEYAVYMVDNWEGRFCIRNTQNNVLLEMDSPLTGKLPLIFDDEEDASNYLIDTGFGDMENAEIIPCTDEHFVDGDEVFLIVPRE